MRFKLFEEYDPESDGFIQVPPDFEERLKGAEDIVKRQKEAYSEPLNQIKIDLYYGIKSQIRNWLDDVKRGFSEKTQEEYEKYLNNEIYRNGSGILKKFAGGKYNNIEDVEEVKSILWKYINERIPYNEVDYYYTYRLDEKLLELLDNFLVEIQEEGLFSE